MFSWPATQTLRGAFLCGFICLGAQLPLHAQSMLFATLTASDATPDPGQSITLTASFEAYMGELDSASIYNLGSGNRSGQSGGTSIGTKFFSGESSGSMSTSFTIPSGTAAGSYTFRTYVVDFTGSSANAWLVVTVQSPAPANTAPTVSISASPTSLTAGGSVTITATASDTDGTIASVKFYRGGFAGHDRHRFAPINTPIRTPRRAVTASTPWPPTTTGPPLHRVA